MASGLALAAFSPVGAPARAQATIDLNGQALPQLSNGGLSIDDSRFLVALALIHDDPVSQITAWAGDTHRIGDTLYQAFVDRFPVLADMPRVSSSAEPFAMETVLAVAPQAAVFSLGGSGPSSVQVDQLAAAGIASVFIDFFNNPFANQATSLEVLASLIGRSERAAAFNAFRAERLDRIAERVAALPAAQRPTVLLEAHAGMTPDCCNSPGRGNVGDYIEFVGGHNIGADVLDAPSGKLNLEYVIDRDPDIYIATGGAHLENHGGLVVGPEFSDERARESLIRIAARPGIEALTAVQTGRVHGLAHQLINSPIDIVAIEMLARWIHPTLFPDIDARRTLHQINTRFLAVPYRGDYWITLVTD